MSGHRLPKHLSLDELKAAVYDSWKSEEQQAGALTHMKACKLCCELVTDEQRDNPLVAMHAEAEDKEAFWREIDQIRREVEEEVRDKLNNK